MNNFIDNIYVINMDKDTDRLDKITKEFNKFNIKFQRFTGIDSNTLSEKKKTNILLNFVKNTVLMA